jgi:CheY-like chemotaxis protein
MTTLTVNSSILVVDDDPAFRGLAQRVLAAFGLGVAGEAGTARSAMAAADALRTGFRRGAAVPGESRGWDT